MKKSVRFKVGNLIKNKTRPISQTAIGIFLVLSNTWTDEISGRVYKDCYTVLGCDGIRYPFNIVTAGDEMEVVS